MVEVGTLPGESFLFWHTVTTSIISHFCGTNVSYTLS